MGFCLYGNDIDDTTSPLEAGLGWITKFSKDFINSEALKAQKEAGLSRRLTGFIMEDRGIPRHDYAVLNEEGENIGVVTSGTQAPSLGKAIGMAYLQKAYLAEGTEIFIQVRNKQLRAKVAKAPFYKA
jgi:aminomethyltransferase